VSAYRSLAGSRDDAPGRARPILPEEVDALLDHRGGLEHYRRDERWRRDVVDHYRHNLRRMVAMTRKRGVPLILVNPVSNLADCPPFKSEHREGITPAEKERWTELREAARETYRTDRRQAIARLEAALEIDDEHAGIHFQLGKYLESQGLKERAREAYLRAKELDVCPLRILEPMNRAVLDVARETATPVVDVKALFEQRSDDGIPGSNWLVDHVHPSIPGHRVIANALADEVIRRFDVEPRADWIESRDRRYRDHLLSLDHLYFAQGTRRLESLLGWAQGRAGTELREAEPKAEEEQQ
jgi:tetratricopeptide (TPR) repeat protein